MEVVVKWQTIIIFIIIIMQLISQNHFSLCLYIFSMHFINNRAIKWKIHKIDVNFLKNKNLMIHYKSKFLRLQMVL
jgi:hypothetical protein